MSSWKDVIATVAPGLATMLGGPLAGMAVKAISEKLLGKPDGTEDEVAQAVATMSPADMVKLKEIEADTTKALTDAGVKMSQIDAGDRDSARKREIDTHDKTPQILAVLILALYGYVLYRLMGGDVPKDDAQVLMMMYGALTAAVTQVLNYFFGSTSQSAAKNATIAKAVKGT